MQLVFFFFNIKKAPMISGMFVLYSLISSTLLSVYLPAYAITHTPHNQFIKKNEQYTSRLLKADRTMESKPTHRRQNNITRKYGRHRRGKKENLTQKTFSKMSYQELEQAKNRQISEGNKEIAIKYLEKMLKLCDNIIKSSEHLLELADLSFDCSKFEKAGKIYFEFINLYPGSKQMEYSFYKAILCLFRQTNDPERDQSKTEETIQLADRFLEQTDIFHQYKDKVYAIQIACYQKLIESEMNICTFYINKGSCLAAQKRLGSLRTQWLPKIPTIESDIISLELALAEKRGDKEIVDQKQEELTKKEQPNVILVAKNQHMAHRF